jgi:hypothetical protein
LRYVEAAGERGEGIVDVKPSPRQWLELLLDVEAPEAIQPDEGALNDPLMLSQSLAAPRSNALILMLSVVANNALRCSFGLRYPW